MKKLILAAAEESRLNIFNEYEPFNFNFVLLLIKKDVSLHDQLE